MRVYPLVLVALALIAGTAGYVTHRVFSAPEVAVDQATPIAPVLPTATASPTTAEPGAPLDWSFVDLDGQRQALKQWRGEVTVLNFWATWCPPCLREIPAFIDLQTRFEAAGLSFVGIALDKSEVVKPFVANKGINYPVVVGDQNVVKFMQTLGNAIGGLPYTAVLDARGEVVYTHQGEWEAADAEAFLGAQLKAE